MHEISNDVIIKVIETLKQLDVRGFDSMNRVVGLVGFFESLFDSPTIDTKDEAK